MNRPTMNNGAIIKLFNNSGGQRLYVSGGQRHSRNASFQLQTHENVMSSFLTLKRSLRTKILTR